MYILFFSRRFYSMKVLKCKTIYYILTIFLFSFPLTLLNCSSSSYIQKTTPTLSSSVLQLSKSVRNVCKRSIHTHTQPFLYIDSCTACEFYVFCHLPVFQANATSMSWLYVVVVVVLSMNFFRLLT